MAPFYRSIAHALLHQTGYETTVLIAILFVAVTIVSGIQDGIAQGFRAFRYLARLKLILAVAGLALIVPAARLYGLDGVFSILLGLLVVKLVCLAVKVRSLRNSAEVPHHGSPASFMQVMVHFALPSMSVSFMFGWAMWSGLYLTSLSAAGFAAVAVINVGLQWRGPAQLFTASLSNVAVPYFSRHLGASDHDRAGKLRRKLLWANALLAVCATAPVAIAAPLIMSIYGPGFNGGAWPFALILLSVVPNALFLLIVIVLDRRFDWRQTPAEF